MCRCEGGTKSNPCAQNSEYTLDWVMESVALCQEHFDEEDNSIKLREHIASEIENGMYVLLQNCTSEEARFIRDQAAKIARGNNAIL